MSQQVYNVGIQGTNNIVSVLNPYAEVDYTQYINKEVDALEYDTSVDAAGIATYLHGVYPSVTYVVVGPHPRPH